MAFGPRRLRQQAFRGVTVVREGLVLASAFAVMNGFVLSDLVGHGTAASADGTTDERAFAASGEGADSGAAGCGASDDLDAGVVTVIVCGLSGFGALVMSLGEAANGKGAEDSKGNNGLGHVEFHLRNL